MTNGLRDPFNKKTGIFADNVRVDLGEYNDDELRDSLRLYGWDKEFPAIVDEYDVVLVGHRRLKFAARVTDK